MIDPSRSHIHLKNIIAFSFLLNVLIGSSGSFITDPALQHFVWAVSSFFMIIGASLMSSKLTRAGHDIPAAGFIVLSIGQATSYAFLATHDAGQEQFGAVIAIFIPGLILISMYNIIPLWMRVAGFLSALCFGTLAVCIFQEMATENVQFISTALAYGLMNLVTLGWAWLIYSQRI